MYTVPVNLKLVLFGCAYRTLMEKPFDALSERTSVAENLVKYLQESCSEIESRKRNMDLVRESLVERMMEIECLRESLEKRLKDLEEREKEFDVFKEGKKRKLASEEGELSLKREEFLNDVKLKEEELDEQLVSVKEHVEWLGVAQAEVQGIRRRAYKKLKEIESQEEDLRSARESLAERERKVDLIIGTLDERISAVEEREKEFSFFLEGKMRELVLKEEQLRMKWEEFVEQVKLADEKFRKQEKLKHGFIERLELAENKLETMRAKIDERFKEIECRENMAWESVAVSVKEADLIRESVEKQLEEFEKMKREFNSFQEDKMRELASKEQLLNVMSKELIKDAKLRNGELIEREKLGHQLLKRLELAQDNVEGLKRMVHERFKEIGLKEIRLNSISDWVERKMDEVDSKAKELEEQEQRITKRENNVISKENELQGKKKELDLKEKTLWAWQKEIEAKQKIVDSEQQLNGQQSEKLDVREKNLNSVREFTRSCFKEHLAIKRKLLFEKDLVAKSARDLGLREDRLEHALRLLEFRERQMRDHVEELELKQQRSTNVLDAIVKNEPDESVDLKFIVRMDGKTLQMFLNDPEKDLESMGDEIFKVLHLSSDPAKLVLDAMVGFYPPHLRKGDVEFNVRRTCITLLQQLIRMSQKIKPYVGQEAIELATAWKSKMRATAENPNSLEVLGFLLLLAAYNLTSYFDKDEITSFLMMVAQHRETLQLYRILGFAERTTEFQEEFHKHSQVRQEFFMNANGKSFPQAITASVVTSQLIWELDLLKWRKINANWKSDKTFRNRVS